MGRWVDGYLDGWIDGWCSRNIDVKKVIKYWEMVLKEFSVLMEGRGRVKRSFDEFFWWLGNSFVFVDVNCRVGFMFIS